MTLSTYLTGLGVLGIVIASLALGARSIRARIMPDWSGPSAVLVDFLMILAALIGASEALGAVGLFSTWPIFGACFTVGVTATLLGRSRGRKHVSGLNDGNHDSALNHRDIPNPASRFPITIALVALALVLSFWLPVVISSLRGGMREYDTLWYHMPFAARFVQTGSITSPHYVNNAPDAFLPANSEILHGIGILAFSTDIMSPLLNLGWLALILLAAWCIGSRFRAGPATLVTAALPLSVPVMIQSQAGTAKNDIVGLAFLLVAVAVLFCGSEKPATHGLAAISVGLAVGTRAGAQSDPTSATTK